MTKASGKIRAATLDDAGAILRIYAPYVEKTAVSFEVDVPSVDEFAGRISEITRRYPWLVFEGQQGIVGYAYGSRHRAREAYRFTTETSVYVDSRYHGAGIGRALYEQLLGELTVRGYRLALAGIALPNAASVRLHESLGFEPVGIFRRIGFKFDRWHDTGWWQKPLGS